MSEFVSPSSPEQIAAELAVLGDTLSRLRMADQKLRIQSDENSDHPEARFAEVDKAWKNIVAVATGDAFRNQDLEQTAPGYGKIIDATRIRPATEVDNPVELEIIDNTTIRVFGQEVPLKGNYLYIFNKLLESNEPQTYHQIQGLGYRGLRHWRPFRFIINSLSQLLNNSRDQQRILLHRKTDHGYVVGLWEGVHVIDRRDPTAEDEVAVGINE